MQDLQWRCGVVYKHIRARIHQLYNGTGRIRPHSDITTSERNPLTCHLYIYIYIENTNTILYRILVKGGDVGERLRPCLNKSLKNKKKIKKKIAIHNNEGYFQLRFRPRSAVADLLSPRAIMTDPCDHHMQRAFRFRPDEFRTETFVVCLRIAHDRSARLLRSTPFR